MTRSGSTDHHRSIARSSERFPAPSRIRFLVCEKPDIFNRNDQESQYRNKPFDPLAESEHILLKTVAALVVLRVLQEVDQQALVAVVKTLTPRSCCNHGDYDKLMKKSKNVVTEVILTAHGSPNRVEGALSRACQKARHTELG